MFRSDNFMKVTGLEEETAEELAKRRVHLSTSPSVSTTSPSPSPNPSPSPSGSSSKSQSPSVSVGDKVKEKKKVKGPQGKVKFVGKAGTAVVLFENGSTGIFPISELEAA